MSLKSLIIGLALASAFNFQVSGALAQNYVLESQSVIDFKAVYGTVEAKDVIPARARLGGTLQALVVSEGDMVKAGQVLARVVDDKIGFQLRALDARLAALQSEFENAESELVRADELIERGVTTAQRRDAVLTRVEVVRNQINAIVQERNVLLQQEAEGDVVAPESGRVLNVPVTQGAVVLPGEQVATIGGGGVFLRLAIPERHSHTLKAGATIEIETESGPVEGRLAKIYPQIENGRVVADVTVPGLDVEFLNARVLVRIPIETRAALMLPADAVETRFGLDFVVVQESEAEAESDRLVFLGDQRMIDGAPYVEILSGLDAGEVVVLP